MVDLSQLGPSYGVSSPEDMVAKALASTTTQVASQQLSPSQMKKFIRLVILEQVGLVDSTNVDVQGASLDIGNFNIVDGQYAVNLGGSTRISTADEVTPVFARRQLNPKAFDFRLPIETTKLIQYNIEGSGINQTADEQLATYVGNTWEDEAWNADTGTLGRSGIIGSNRLIGFDGWLATAISAAHTVDFNGARMSTAIWREMLQAMPTKWRGQGEKYYTSSNAILEWAHYLEVIRGTPLGDSSITSDGISQYQGRDIIPVPKIRDDYAGLNAQSGSTSGFTKVLLTLPGNKAVGYGPNMSYFAHPRDDGKVNFINYWGQMDTDYFNIDRVVIGYNILPTAQCTVACE